MLFFSFDPRLRRTGASGIGVLSVVSINCGKGITYAIMIMVMVQKFIHIVWKMTFFCQLVNNYKY